MTDLFARIAAAQANPFITPWAKNTIASIVDSSRRYGSMTPKQEALVTKLVEEIEGKNRRKEPVEVKKVDLSRVNELFDRSTARLKKPFCIFATYRKVDGKDVIDQEFRISKAPETGSNPGSLYVKRAGAYQGKIARDGTYSASRDAAPDVLSALEVFASDPLASALAYGQASGNCARCGKTLTNPVSVEAGMGPVCRSFFAWGE